MSHRSTAQVMPVCARAGMAIPSAVKPMLVEADTMSACRCQVRHDQCPKRPLPDGPLHYLLMDGGTLEPRQELLC